MPRKKYAILVAEDAADIREQIVDFLGELGYTIHTATTGKQVMDILHREPIDLLLLDNAMSDMSGYDIIIPLKQDRRLCDIPVIMISDDNDIESVVKFIEIGADDHLPKTFQPVLLKARIESSLAKKQHFEEIKKERTRSDSLLNVVMPIGISLIEEKDLDHLLETILKGAELLCNADAGTIYLRTEENQLRFVISNIRSKKIKMGGTSGEPIPYPPIDIFISGKPNHRSVSSHAAITGENVNIPDINANKDFDFTYPQDYGVLFKYESNSMLAIPLKNNKDYVIGVLQLINAVDPEKGWVIPFDGDKEQMAQALSAMATAALEAYYREQSLRREIHELRIEIDEMKRDRQVDEITHTDYFQEILQRADDFRKEDAQPSA